MGVPAGAMRSAGGGRLGKTDPLIALRAHDELSGKIGRESSIGGGMT